MDDTRQKHSIIRVLMFPWLAHGHISPFLQLAKKLSDRNYFQIHLCSTPVNLHPIREKLGQIKPVELHLPSISPELPPHYHTTNGLPPHLMPTLKSAFDMSSPEFFDILKTLHPDLLIYDFLQPWAPAAASSLNIPAVMFQSTGAAMPCFLHHRRRKPGTEFPFPDIRLTEHESSWFNALVQSSDLRVYQCLDRSSNFCLIKTFREIEAKYLDYLSDITNKRMVPVGPLLEEDEEEEEEGARDILEEWLDKKGKASSVFVSFGSEYFVSKEEMEEIAHGLELSEVPFIWVVRFPMGERTNLEDALPEGFLQRVGERGMVVEGWAPQRKILGHSSIGGFVSHCGWSSVMEGMKLGVPIIAMPMHLDQPINAKLVEAVGVGREIKRDEKGKLEREEIGKVIRGVVVDEISVRRKARKMSEVMRKKGDEEIDVVVEELLQLCSCY